MERRPVLAHEISTEIGLETRVDTFFKRPMAMDVRQERLAQQLLNKPDESVAWLVGFETHLRNVPAISLMLEHNPRRGERKIMRTLRKVTLSAITTLAYNRTVEAMMPLLENGKSLCSELDAQTPYRIESPSVLSEEDEVYTGNAAAFIRGVSRLLGHGWSEALSHLKNPDDSYYPIWECFEAIHEHHMFYVGLKNFSAEQQCETTIEDNAFVALELLTHVRAEYANECESRGIKPSAYGAMYKALRSADALGQSASGTSAAIGKVIGTNRLARHLPAMETGSGKIITEHLAKKALLAQSRDPRFYRYNHVSLQEGPWPGARFCPAVPWLQSAEPRDQQAMQAFDRYLSSVRRQFAPQGQESQEYEPDLTLYIRSTLLLQIGALVGRETIFKDWPK